MRLRSPVVRITGTVFAREYPDEQHADDKSPDVRPPRDTAHTGCSRTERCKAGEELHDEPEAKHDDGRYLDDLEEDKNWNQCQDARSWIGHDIGAKDAGNSAARADAGDHDVIIKNRVGDSSAQTAQEI